MTETCNNCNILDDSNANENIVHYHLCSKTFHACCVNIDIALFDYLSSNKNLSWSCNVCIDESKLETNSSLKMIMQKLTTMSDDIEALKSKTAPKPSFSHVLRNDAETPRSFKRRADDKVPLSVKRPRVVTPAVVIGTGASNDVLKAAAPMKWLYVSRLDSQTSEEAVTNVLTAALQADANVFSCVKLVPKMQNPTFISFKVGMTEDLFGKSMAPEIWPPGIAIREFVNRPRIFFGPLVVRL
jgi:hypothetical protein